MGSLFLLPPTISFLCTNIANPLFLFLLFRLVSKHKSEIEESHAELNRAKTSIQRLSVQTNVLKSQNETLEKANKELTSICDDLMAQQSK